MIKRYRLVVFDWEGTLSDTLGHVLCTLTEQALRLGFSPVEESLIRDSASLGLSKAITKLWPRLTVHEHEQLLCLVQQALANSAAPVRLFPGVKSCLEALHQADVMLAIATNKGPQSLRRILQESGLAAFFQATRAAGQVAPKPSAQMIEEIMAECGVSPAEALMVGDSIVDVEMACNAGVDAVGFDFYHEQRTALMAEGALDVFDDYAQLCQCVLNT